MQRWDVLLPWLLPPWLQAMYAGVEMNSRQSGSAGGRHQELRWSPDVCNISTVQVGVAATETRPPRHGGLCDAAEHSVCVAQTK